MKNCLVAFFLLSAIMVSASILFVVGFCAIDLISTFVFNHPEIADFLGGIKWYSLAFIVELMFTLCLSYVATVTTKKTK